MAILSIIFGINENNKVKELFKEVMGFVLRILAEMPNPYICQVFNNIFISRFFKCFLGLLLQMLVYCISIERYQLANAYGNTKQFIVIIIYGACNTVVNLTSREP